MLLILAGELALRTIGFCNAPLYYNNEYTGYNLVANQSVFRFGNTYETNEYSMRSEALGDHEFRITLFGDSVLNGGIQTDQSELASTLLERYFQEEYSDEIRVLNVSCGGWGIDNDAGVVNECGDFDSSLFVIVLSSHDAVGTISSTPIAGVSKSFPSKQYSLAWVELFDRYLIPRIQSKLGIGTEDNSTNTSEGDDYSEGWEFFRNYCEENDIDLMFYLHATLTEVSNGEYDENGQWIINFAEENDIPLYLDIEYVSEDDYRDNIHFNADGQEVIYKILGPVLDEYIDVNYLG
ncbi:MAG: hypothetical protein LUH18_02610 [Oscillospiraceae bacterium]|nr:hypothetical protein [Oscillospiraceae bacterium]